MSQTILNAAKNNFSSDKYQYKLGGKGEQIQIEGKIYALTDCSWLQNNATRAAGYNIPYLSTSQMYKSDGTLSAVGAQYYEIVPASSVQAGDIVMFQGHVGIVEQWNSATSKGSFYGAQSSGIASANISTSDNAYWGDIKPLLGFIRPKASTYVANMDQTVGMPTITQQPPSVIPLPTGSIPTLKLPTAGVTMTKAQRYEATKLSDAEFYAFKEKLASIEVAGFEKNVSANYGYGKTSDSGKYLGRYQMGPLALVEAGYMKPSVTGGFEWTGKDGISSQAGFLASPASQDKALRAYADANARYLVNYNLDLEIDSDVGGSHLTKIGLLLASHNSIGSLKTYVATEGATNPVDGNNFSISNYVNAGNTATNTLTVNGTVAGAVPYDGSGPGIPGLQTSEIIPEHNPDTGTYTWWKTPEIRVTLDTDNKVRIEEHIDRTSGHATGDKTYFFSQPGGGTSVHKQYKDGTWETEEYNGAGELGQMTSGSVDGSFITTTSSGKVIEWADSDGSDLIHQAMNPVSANSKIFDLSVDTVSFSTPEFGDIGGVVGDWGLLGLGVGFHYAMEADFVNLDGGQYLAPGAVVTNGFRPGNFEESPITWTLDALQLSAMDFDFDPWGGMADVIPNMDLANTFADLSFLDPLTLDQDDDDIRLSAKPSTFDMNGDQSAESILMPSPRDPVLVFDLDGNGQIDNGSELVDLTGTGKPLSLQFFDENSDGRIDASDQGFFRMRLWEDRNQDGYTSEHELSNLSDLDIRSIATDPVTSIEPIAGFTGIKGVMVLYDDLRTRTLWDIPFPALGSGTVQTSYLSSTQMRVTVGNQSGIVVTSATAGQIDLNTTSARQAFGNKGDDTLIGSIGADWLVGGSGADQFSGGRGMDLLVIDADDAQELIDGGEDIDTLLISDERGVLLNLAKANVEAVYGGYGADVLIGGGADNYFIDAGLGDDLVIGGLADDALTGGDGDDEILGGQGDDLLRGGRGDDSLSGEAQGDVLDGGAGNDTLDGGEGGDVFIESTGMDVVRGGAGIDILQLNDDISDYVVTATANGYVITHRIPDASGDPFSVSIQEVEKLSYEAGRRNFIVDLGTDDLIPVRDDLQNSTASSYTFLAKDLVANDIDFTGQSSALLMYWAGNATGGTLSSTKDSNGNILSIVFNADPDYVGPMGFTYKIKDAQGHVAIKVAPVHSTLEAQEIKGVVTISTPSMPTDPDYKNQWHLAAIGAPKVWSEGYTGEGVSVLVIEPSGPYATSRQVADLTHPDLAPNQITATSENPDRQFVDTPVHSLHATQVVGVIAAARNGVGGVGVAHNAKINSIGLGDDHYIQSWEQTEVDLWKMWDYDVVNHSWIYDKEGAWGDYKGYTVASMIFDKTIGAAAYSGREGRGTVMVFGAGNGRDMGADAGLSKLTSNPYSITVAGVNRGLDAGLGYVNKAFSSRGANILVAAPASNILTTSVSLEGSNGATYGEESAEVDGTSFAAPIVSGVAALMLEANPELNYRDVQTILALTATRAASDNVAIDTSWSYNKNTRWNGTGMHFSADVGFGMVNALAAVRMAETWIPAIRFGMPQILNDEWNWSGRGTTKTFGVYAVATTPGVPDMGSRTLLFNINSAVELEHATIRLSLEHQRWADLVITLVSPSGTRSVLLDRPGMAGNEQMLGNPDTGLFLPTLMSTHFRGESGQGQWQLVIEDKRQEGVGFGTIDAQLSITGISTTAPDQYVLTDEYGGSWTITPSTTDSELNASAVLAGGVNLDLSGATNSWVNGKVLKVNTGIGRTVGSGGNDTIKGSNVAETIMGGLGTDQIDGRSGNDTLQGGTGNDLLQGSDGHDKLDGGSGDDRSEGGAGNDLLVAGEGRDTLSGGSGADAFLVTGGQTGTTTIDDFSSAAGDFLVLQSGQDDVTGVTQSYDATAQGLIVRFTSQGMQSTVLLKGVTAALSTSSLKVIPAVEMVAKALDGSFIAGKNQLMVSAVPNPYFGDWHGSGSSYWQMSDASLPYSKLATGYSYTIVDAAKTSYAEQVNGPIVIQLAEYQYVQLPVYIGAASWDGWLIDEDPMSSESAWEFRLRNLVQYGSTDKSRIYYSNQMGTDQADYMIAGSTTKPSNITWDWNQALVDAGPRRYFGAGGDDEIQGDGRDEELAGGDGGDILNGGGGQDWLDGGEGADTFVFSSGHGADTIQNYELDDVILFNDGLTSVSTQVSYEGIWNRLGYLSDKPYEPSGHPFEANIVISTSGGSISLTSRLSHADIVNDNFYLYRYRMGAGPVQLASAVSQAPTDANDLIIQQNLSTNKTDFNALGGDDIIYSLKNNAIKIDGGSGRDYITVKQGSNVVHGGSGDDQLIIQPTAYLSLPDSLYGDAGNDMLTGSDAGDRLEGGLGHDKVYGGGGADSLYGDDDNDLLYGNAGDDDMDGGNGADKLEGMEGSDLMQGGSGNDTLMGGLGSDTCIGGAGDDVLYGNAGDNGMDGNDLMQGGSGNDTLTGGLGSDTYIGGAGDDVFQLAQGDEPDYIILGEGTGNDALAGLERGDTLVFQGIDSGALSYPSTAYPMYLRWSENDSIFFTNEDISLYKDVTLQFDDGSISLHDYLQVTYRGTSVNDWYAGGISDDYLSGEGGNDTFSGGFGNDTLIGGAGIDFLYGEYGDDIYVIDTDDLAFLFGEEEDSGIDEVQGAFNLDLYNYANFENATLLGTGSFSVNGNSVGNRLTGNGGANILSGHEGDDSLFGQGGDDSFSGGIGTDLLTDDSTISSDTYYWGVGDGVDTVVDAGGASDKLMISALSPNKLWLHRQDNNLEVSILGTSDKLVVSGWYASPTAKIESISVINGGQTKNLAGNTIQALVDEMARFAPPTGFTAPAELNPVINSMWQ